jgi:hypothetical protein
MKAVKGKTLFIVIAILGAAAAVLPLVIYSAIETASMHMGDARMQCYSACVAETIIGVVIALIALGSLFLKSSRLSLTSSAALLVGGIAAIVVPRALGFCEHEAMACRYITAPTLAIIGSAIIILSAVKLSSGILAIRKSASAS